MVTISDSGAGPKRSAPACYYNPSFFFPCPPHQSNILPHKKTFLLLILVKFWLNLGIFWLFFAYFWQIRAFEFKFP